MSLVCAPLVTTSAITPDPSAGSAVIDLLASAVLVAGFVYNVTQAAAEV